MGIKRHGSKEVIGKLREAEVLMAKGATTAEAAKAIGGEGPSLRTSRPTTAGGVSTAG